MHVWFVDDRPANRETWLASFPDSVRSVCTLRTFASVRELFAALDAGAHPDVLFVDFFIDGHHGIEVVERLVSGDAPVPLLIAHSSMARANDAMIRAGAHFAMEKMKGVPITRSIVEAVRGPEDLRVLVKEHTGR